MSNPISERMRMSMSLPTPRAPPQRSGITSQAQEALVDERSSSQSDGLCKKYEHWTAEHWKRVVWSDEAKFELFGSKRRQYCWVKPGAPLTSRQVQSTVKHGGGNIMMWGCFTAHGIGYLCRIDDGLDAELYRRTLGDADPRVLSSGQGRRCVPA